MMNKMLSKDLLSAFKSNEGKHIPFDIDNSLLTGPQTYVEIEAIF